MIRVGLDSNILAYRSGVDRAPDDAEKIGIVRKLLHDLASAESVILVAPVQALGELYVVSRRAGINVASIGARIDALAATLDTPPTDVSTALAAVDLAARHRFQFWDAVIVSAAIESGCTLLLSEDMQHGFCYGELTIVNPFATPVHPKLNARLLGC